MVFSIKNHQKKLFALYLVGSSLNFHSFSDKAIGVDSSIHKWRD